MRFRNGSASSLARKGGLALSAARSFLRSHLSLRSNGSSEGEIPESNCGHNNRRYANDPSSGKTSWPDNTPSCSVLCAVVSSAWEDDDMGYSPSPSHPIRCAEMCKCIQHILMGWAIEGWSATTGQRGRSLPSIEDQSLRGCSIDKVH